MSSQLQMDLNFLSNVHMGSFSLGERFADHSIREQRREPTRVGRFLDVGLRLDSDFEFIIREEVLRDDGVSAVCSRHEGDFEIRVLVQQV